MMVTDRFAPIGEGIFHFYAGRRRRRTGQIRWVMHISTTTLALAVMLVVMEALASAHPQGIRPAKGGRRKHRDPCAVAFARKSAPLLERRRGFRGHLVENFEEEWFLHLATPVCQMCATPSRLTELGCSNSSAFVCWAVQLNVPGKWIKTNIQIVRKRISVEMEAIGDHPA